MEGGTQDAMSAMARRDAWAVEEQAEHWARMADLAEGPPKKTKKTKDGASLKHSSSAQLLVEHSERPLT